MNIDIIPQQSKQDVRRLRQQIEVEGEELARLLTDRKKLMEKVEELNSRAVICISNEKCQQALVYLESAEKLLQLAAEKGHLIDRCLVQCILHNEANCFQNLWQLDQCSNYIEALIFNINSRKNPEPSSPSLYDQKERKPNKIGLAEYYLQFCAVNSQLGNHSGALISARKSLCLIRADLKDWRRFLLENRKQRAEAEQKLRLLQLTCRFNDNINLNLLQTLVEAVSYYLKSWKLGTSNNKNLQKEVRELIEGFTIKTVMAIPRMSYEDCIKKYEKDIQMSLYDIYERIFILSTCYFTIATELRLISLKTAQEKGSDKTEEPQFKESQIYHLLAILILALTITSNSPFISHLLVSFQNHYNKNLMVDQINFKKVFGQIIFLKEDKNIRETSIVCSDPDEGLASHLSKGSGTIIRKTKGSKQSERQNKFSFIDPKNKKSKLKQTKRKQSKSKKEISSAKNKNPRPSLSKSPNFKSNSKESIVIKSQKSKESLHQKSSIPSIPSIKLITISNRIKPMHASPKNVEKEKNILKGKRKIKLQQNGNEYFLVKKGDQKKPKKSSLSSKKNYSQPRSTGRLPIDSTLETKDNHVVKDKKKSAKKSILQHYM